MSLQLSNSLFFARKESHFRCFSHVSASLDTGVRRVTSAKIASTCFEETKERIADLIHKAELSVSTYDTAWVAMVPSPNSSQEPCFPDCLSWLLQNQCCDGSWACPHHHPLLKKDVLCSTLACVLALKKWGVGEEKINRGVHFIEHNFASAMEKCQISPMGFDIIFPAMLDYARDLLLNLRLEPTMLNDLIYKRGLELKRNQNHSAEREAYLAYVAEGMGKLQDLGSVMKHQRRNGSLFNSPSTTAAAFIAFPNSRCLTYLRSALKKFGSAVPAVYPLDIYLQLCTVDNLERLGISRYFQKEIQGVLDETYRCWLQGNEEIFMDAPTCALAFRVLRKNGYNVTSDPITKLLEECFSSSFCGNIKDINTTLGLYRASEFILYPDERDLEKQNLMLKNLLEQELSSDFIHSSQLGRNIDAEVKHALEYPFYADLDRIVNRRNIEHYNFDNTRILKTSYCSPNFGNKDFLFLSVKDYNECQAIHREELRELERWVIENRLDELRFARQKCAYCYFSAAATLFAPELSNARMSWAKNGVLTTVVDDFFDLGGSVEELKNLIQLVELWDVDVSTECSSQNVQIIFSALKCTICDIGDKGSKLQERSITNHIIDIWLDLLYSMMKETEWARDKYIPTMDEYISNAYVSFALGPIVLPALYLVGPKLSEEMVHHSEYHNLYKLMSTCGRLLNDIRGCERELKEGKLNAIPLYIINNGGEITKEAAASEMKSLIETHRRELLRLVLEGKNSVLPKSCKELFWHMSKVLHLFYSKDDGFTSQDLIKVVKAVIYEPIVLK
uniref:Ent-kaurene synthase TSP4, chloroplastic n=1 Tax=Vitex agnus-castus TaxID=54477 RepID=TPS4_VITAC|nr:RecName: Full=Ent-kaurene synthase TSP4, chloroplastic; AltName: Full=Terpene synthase 4; Short=VacTPS4 [Vitex agnus-castus]AUT77123.1 ent-kaurene synthase [Vitex agnus-castus]